MGDNLRSRITWLERELREEEEEEEYFEEDSDEFEDELEDIKQMLKPGYNYAVDFSRAVYADEEYVEEDYADPAPKKKGIKGLVFLAFLEVLGILAIIGWWLRWLI